MLWPMISLDGQVAFKVVPCRIPPIRHFQRIAPENEWNLLDAVEAMTDEQARDEIGQIELVPAQERWHGTHAAPIMAAFTSFDPAGSLFSDGSYGVLYLQMQRDAAISSGRRAASAFLAATAQRPLTLQYGLYAIGLACTVADLRKNQALHSTNRTDDAVAASRNIGRQLRAAGIAGALFADSLAVLRTSALSTCARHAYIEMQWDGKAIDSVNILSTTTDTDGT